jgi:hypothetical protein
MQNKNILNVLLSLLIFILALTFYVWFYYKFQMSMIVTANGMWKALDIIEYLNGTGSLEYGDLLYYPIIKVFYLFLKNYFELNTYDAIVSLNGLSAAILTAGIFFL